MSEEKKNKNLQWYILKSSSGKENKTAELLKQRVRATNIEDQITEVVVPMQEKIVIKAGKKSTIQERIFPGYVLVQMEATDDTIHLVINTEGIAGFVGNFKKGKMPIPLSDKEVKGILEFTKVKQLPTYQSQFQKGDAVKVVDGPFKEFVGTVQEINETKGQVTILLSIFDRETPVQLDFLQVNKI